MKLSDTQRAVLTAAAQHSHHLALPPDRLPAGARQKVADALLQRDLVATVDRVDQPVAALWTVAGDAVLLQITDEGLRAIGFSPDPVGAELATVAEEQVAERGLQDQNAPQDEDDEQSAEAILARNAARLARDAEQHRIEAERLAAEAEKMQDEDRIEIDAAIDPLTGAAGGAPDAPAQRTNLRDAALAILATWDCKANREDDMITALGEPIAALRAALAGKPATRATGAPRAPREGTKQDAVIALLRRDEGATVAQISETTGWAAHTVRGFFAGLKKKGIEVSVLERVRKVGPNQEGARGSYTVYQVKPD